MKIILTLLICVFNCVNCTTYQALSPSQKMEFIKAVGSIYEYHNSKNQYDYTK